MRNLFGLEIDETRGSVLETSRNGSLNAPGLYPVSHEAVRKRRSSSSRCRRGRAVGPSTTTIGRRTPDASPFKVPRIEIGRNAGVEAGPLANSGPGVYN